MTETLIRQLIDRVASRVIAANEELTLLDRQIGDGDHGLNMKRGFEAVLAQVDQVAAKPLPDALKAIGNTLVMKVGGASGPLYGTLFINLGKELSGRPDLQQFARALEVAIGAIKRLGKSEPGYKTMLDVLVPVQQLIGAGGADLPSRVTAAAAEAAQSTVPMKAVRGRASFLGDRSIGHMDPGARSSQIIVTSICEVLS